MDPQNANPSGQSPDGTFSNDNNTGGQMGAPMPNSAQTPAADPAAASPTPMNNFGAPNSSAQETPNMGTPATPLQTPVAPGFQQAATITPSQDVQSAGPASAAPSVFVGG